MVRHFHFPDYLSNLRVFEGKPFAFAKHVDVTQASSIFRYYAGWTDKIHGNTIETNPAKFNFTRHEPIGVCGLIIPWNIPCKFLSIAYL